MKKHLILAASVTALLSLGVINGVHHESTIKVAADFAPVTVEEYYKNINTSHKGDTLKSDLYNLIKGHTKYDYGSAEVAMKDTDRDWTKSPDPDDENPIMNLLYAGYNDTNPQRWNKSQGSYGTTVNGQYVWNKEHIWAKSNGFPSKGCMAYSDLHHLRASDWKLNNTRSDNPLGNSSSVSYDKDCFGNDSQCKGTNPFEPADEYKGDCARALFYMATRYSTGDGSDSALSLTTGTYSSGGRWGYLDALLEWNELDPPDEFEKNRNQIIYEKYQHNRNPYIDHPEYARAVFMDEPIVEPKVLTNLTISGTPNKTSYKEGESFVSTGVTVTAYFDDLSSENVTSSVVWDAVTASTITGRYTHGSVTLSVQVSGLTVIKLNEVVKEGTLNKTIYTEGEEFDPSGLTIRANYSDNSSEVVTSIVSWTPSTLSYGDTTVTGSFGNKSVTVTGLLVNKVATATYQITFKSASSDSSTDLTKDTLKGEISEGADYVSSCASPTKAYAGKSGIKLGSGSAAGKFTLNLSSDGQVVASSIILGASKYGSDGGQLKVSVNGNSLGQQSPPSQQDELVYEISSPVKITTIQVETTTKRAYVKYIKITSGSGESDVVQTWIDSYMHMDDPNYSGSGTGLCSSSGTYLLAKQTLMSLDITDINRFENDEGDKYTAALARYLAWAKANYDDSPFSGTTIVSSYNIENIDNYSQSYILITVVSALTVLAFGTTILIRKRKK